MPAHTIISDHKLKTRLLVFLQGIFFFLLLVFPFQKKHRIFKSLSSWMTSGFSFSDVFPHSIYFYLTDIGLIAIPLCLVLMRKKISSFLFSGSAKYLTVLLAISFTSLLFSKTSHCLLHYVRLSHFFLFLLFFATLESGLIFKEIKNVFSKICLAIFFLSLFECTVGISQYFTQGDIGLKCVGEGRALPAFFAPKGRVWILDQLLGRSEEGKTLIRSMGTFEHPNIFGGFMMVATVMSYYLFSLTQEKKQRLLIGCGILLQVLTLFLTFSRAALFGWALASMAWVFFSLRIKEEKSMSRKPVLIALAISLIFSLWLVYPALKERGGVINYNVVSQVSDHGRIFFQKIAFEMIKEHPIVGVGFNHFVLRMQDFAPETLTRLQFYPVHNIYLLIASETGLFGLLAFLLFLGSILIRALKAPMTLEIATLLSILLSILFVGGCDYYWLASQHGKVLFFSTCGLLSYFGSLRVERPAGVL